MGAEEDKAGGGAMEDPVIPRALDGVERTIGQRSRDHPGRSDRRPLEFAVDDE